MDINFDLYKIFYIAAKTANFSKAASELYISQSAVSQAIKNLESKLGVPLFLRNSRHLSLTPEGKLLYTHAEQAFNLFKTAEQKINAMQNFEAGEIRIGASDTICKYFLLPYLEKFNYHFPKVKIRVINRTSCQIIEILKNGLIDFGVVTIPENHQKLTYHELFSVEDIFVASERFRELKDIPVKLSRLAGYPLLMLEKTSFTRQIFDNFQSRLGLSLQPEIELESVDILVEFAKIGLGLAYCIKESVARELSSGELFKVDIEEPLPWRSMGIVTAEQIPLSQTALKFLELLTANHEN